MQEPFYMGGSKAMEPTGDLKKHKMTTARDGWLTTILPRHVGYLVFFSVPVVLNLQ